MKGSKYVISLLAIVVIGLVGSIIYMYQKAKEPIIMQDIDDIIYTEVVFESQPFYAKFGGTIQADSIENGSIYVKDDKGQRMVVEPQIIQQRLLAIPNLPVGDYKLVVEADVLTERMEHSQTLAFTVYENQEHVTSAEELKRYFIATKQSKEAQNLNDVMVRTTSFFSVSSEDAMVESESSSSMENAAIGASDSDYSETNNQVAGIEEGDIVVTDGDIIYTVREQQIQMTKTKPLQVLGAITLSNMYPTKLMKQGDYLLVFYDDYQQNGSYGMQLTKVNIYDVKNPQVPRLVRELGQEGYMVGTRLMNNTLYMTTEKYDVSAMESNGELRPVLYDSESDQEYVDYKDISIFPGVQGESYTVISAIELDDPGKSELQTYAFLGNSGTFYMSANAIYLAGASYEMIPFEATTSDTATTVMATSFGWWQPRSTKIYKYSVEGTAIDRVAEAEVDGYVLNQFAMDEHKGHFRIATTTGNASLRNADSNNHLTIFDEGLKEVGQLTDLARGEKIYSVRYMGDKAYIVTFKETDPLFVIDVADPTNPHVLGELKIPGFSNYLHPLNDTHLIGIGYETEVDSKNGIVLTQEMKVSLFNVSDVNHPTEVDVELIGGRGTYSDVQHDHKALYRDVQNNYYGFPVTIYDDHIYKGTGATMLEITEQGIEPVGNFMKVAQGEQYEEWGDTVRRLVYSGDTLYIVHVGKIVAYDRKTLEKLEEIEFK